jgi:glycosyltransferase involved in cell wall biosynthesis
VHLALVSHHVRHGDGQSRVNAELTRALLARGVEVTLVAEAVDDALVEAGARWAPVRVRVGAVHLAKVPAFARAADRVLAALVPRPDAVVACGVSTFQPHALNVAHFVHGTWLHSPFHTSRARRGPYAWYHRAYSVANARWERAVFARARDVVAVSPMVRDELVEIGVPTARIHTVVNGVDTAEYAPGPASRADLGLPEGVLLALFAGDLASPVKNADGALRALAATPGLHLALAGGLARSPYPALAERLGVADRAHFLGYRRDLPDLMRAADFFLLPSRRDSCPLVLMEALASGLPVVTTRTVGSADLVERGGAGVVVERPDDEAALAAACRRLAGDPAERAAMALAARAVAENHTWSRMAAAYLDLIERSVGRPAHAHTA